LKLRSHSRNSVDESSHCSAFLPGTPHINADTGSFPGIPLAVTPLATVRVGALMRVMWPSHGLRTPTATANGNNIAKATGLRQARSFLKPSLTRHLQRRGHADAAL
jgi:hypothetical protein